MQNVFTDIRRPHLCGTYSVLSLFLLLLLAACQAMPPAGESAVTTEPVPAKVAVSPDARRFVVDPDASEIRLLVYRAGALARFGHNHVITGRVRGEIGAGTRAAGSGFRLEVPVESFIVDPPEARAEEGAEFSAEVSDQARQATRDNMLGPAVLAVASAPLIEIESIALGGPRWNPTVLARVGLRGVGRTLRFPAAVVENGGVLTVIARFRVRQSDFDLAPFSVLGGGLQVADAIDIRLRLVAKQVKE